MAITDSETGSPTTERRVLTLKHRPQTFTELLVQDHVRDTLSRAISSNRVANAYLFTGPRGVGKTSTARILAKCLNCLESETPTVTPCGRCPACVEITGSRSLDVIEIDGASNRGIDQVRELRENIKYSPSSLRCKIYIIDEVHMLTDAAFNALLKTLEEPPAHARFVFATTEGHQVPATIISRCQRFDFRRATPEEIARRLRWLADKEAIKATDAALLAIARRADGAIRDGESILEQLATYQPDGIEVSGVNEMLGLVPSEVFPDYTGRLLTGDVAGSLQIAESLFDRGFDVLEFYSGLVQHFRNLAYILTGAPTTTLGLLPEELKRLSAQAEQLTRGQVVRGLELLLRVEDSARHTRMPGILLDYLSLELAEVFRSEETGEAPPVTRPARPAQAGKPRTTVQPGSKSPSAEKPKPNAEAGSPLPAPRRQSASTRTTKPPPTAKPTEPAPRRAIKPPARQEPSEKPAEPAADDDELVARMRRILGELDEERR